jgi:hypothetical protein
MITHRKLFSSVTSTMLILSFLLVGVTFQVPDASAVNHTVGKVDINALTDFGRILGGLD